MERFFEAALTLLYPRRCPFCLSLMGKGSLCPSCQRNLRPISGPRCFVCGMSVPEGQELCPQCQKGRSFVRGRGIFSYDRQMRKAVLAFKNGASSFAPVYGQAMAFYGEPLVKVARPSVVTGIPLHPKRERRRGYNQAQLLARELGADLGIPVGEGLLFKVRQTREQKSLDQRERRRNLEGSFQADGSCLGERILLVDDVYTTGSTLDAAAKALMAAGAREVSFLTLCQVPLRQSDQE